MIYLIYPLNPPLIDLLILSMVVKHDSYGYQISQQLKQVSNLKDSSLYPVLKRLSENCYMDIYDQQYQGRNRKYYKITTAGKQQLEVLRNEWNIYTETIGRMIDGASIPEGGNEE